MSRKIVRDRMTFSLKTLDEYGCGKCMLDSFAKKKFDGEREDLYSKVGRITYIRRRKVLLSPSSIARISRLACRDATLVVYVMINLPCSFCLARRSETKHTILAMNRITLFRHHEQTETDGREAPRICKHTMDERGCWCFPPRVCLMTSNSTGKHSFAFYTNSECRLEYEL